MTYKLLITSVGSLVGQSLLEALAPHRHELTIIGTNSVAAARNLFGCDKACLLPPTAEHARFRQACSELLLRERPDIVIPARDEDLPCLAELSRDPRFAESCFLVTAPELAKIFNDKYETWRFAREHGLPFARSAFAPAEVEALIAETGFPLLAKPRWNGHASKDVYLVTDQAQASLLLQEASFVFQPLLNPATLAGRLEGFGRRGIPWLFAMNDIKHLSELVIGRQGEVISISSAVMHCEALGAKSWHILDDPAIDAVALAYADRLSRLGHRGPLNLQGKLLPDGSFVPFELNGRFTGSANARALLDYNQVMHSIGHFLDGQAAWPPHRSGPFLAAVEASKTYQVLRRDAVETLTRQGVWPA